MWPSWRREARLLKTGTNNPDRGQRDAMETPVLDTDDVINKSRISRLQIRVAVLGALILFVDGFDTQVIGYIAPRIASDWNISRDVLGWILAADKIGLLIGYLFVSPLSGYFGHKRVGIGCIAMFGFLACLTTTAGDPLELFFLRLLTGIGLGGTIPSGVALVGEYFPKSRRSTVVTFIYCGLSFGQLSSGEVSRALLDAHGWQGPLWVGGSLALLLASVLAVLLPDSLEYLVNRSGRPERAARILKRVSPSLDIPAGTRLVAGARSGATLTIRQLLPQLFQAGRGFGTVMFWIALGMNLTVNTSLQVWLTKILVDAGFDQHVAIIATEASFAAGIIGAFIIGPLMDRFGAYRVMSSLFACGALFALFLSLSLSVSVVALIAASSFGSGFCTSGIQKAGNALSVYFYPVHLRSTGLGWGLGIGRLGAIFGPVAVGYFLASGWTSSAVFLATMLPMLVGATVIALMGRKYGEKRGEARETYLSRAENLATKA